MAKSAISRQNRNSVPVPNRGGTGTHGQRQSVGTDTDQSGCNTPKYTLAIFDMFRVFCKPKLNVS